MKYIPYIIIAVLVGVIFFRKPPLIQVREYCTTDTIFLTVTDTVKEQVPKYKYRKVVDTMYVYVDGTEVKLPRESKHYSKDSVYDAWVSGYEPSLDSLNVYQRTEYKTVTNELTRTIPERNRNIYLNGGLFKLQDTFVPYVGVSISTKGKMLYGANIGVNNGSLFYGINIGIKINNK